MTTCDSTWPEGTPGWVDLGVDDFDKAMAFYGPHGRRRGLGGLPHGRRFASHETAA